MNKKFNTFLFILGATLFNVVVALLLAVLFIFVLYGAVISPHLPETTPHNFIASMLFIGVIILTFLAYRALLNKLLTKIKFEDYFDPIINVRRPPPKKNG